MQYRTQDKASDDELFSEGHTDRITGIMMAGRKGIEIAMNMHSTIKVWGRVGVTEVVRQKKNEMTSVLTDAVGAYDQTLHFEVSNESK